VAPEATWERNTPVARMATPRRRHGAVAYEFCRSNTNRQGVRPASAGHSRCGTVTPPDKMLEECCCHSWPDVAGVAL
jgi:hypothetical protein